MEKIKFFLYIIIFTLMVSQVDAQFLYDARSVAMAGSNIAIAEGTEHFGGNPATLALKRDFNFELQLISAHFMVKNNSYSLNEYDKYFTTGDSLTTRDIDDLFDQIPDKGLKGDARFGAKALALYSRPFSIILNFMGAGFLNLPKGPLQLPFYGNKDIKEYRLDDLDGEGYAAGAINFAIALPITQWLPYNLDFVSAGISPKYIFGIQYGGIKKAEGKFQTTSERIVINGQVETLRSEGGRGFGLDLGFLAEYRNRWTFSLHFSNLVGAIYWNSNNETGFYEFVADTFKTNDLDSLETKDTDTTWAAGNFTTGLPRAMVAAAAYQYLPNLILTAAWRQGLNHSLNNYTTPLLSLGAEYLPVSVIPLRMGFGIGGEDGFNLGLGLGIDLKYWQLNIAYLNHNFKWFRSAKSMDFALNTQFRF